MESRCAENWIFSGDETERTGRQLVRDEGLDAELRSEISKTGGVDMLRQ
jgi:hypothetical protein